MELIKEEFRKCGKRLLCNVVLERLVAGSFFNRFNTSWRRFLALVMLFFLFEIIELSILVLIKQLTPPISTQPIFISTFFAAFVATLSFYAVSWCYQYTVKLTLDSIRKSKMGGESRKEVSYLVKKSSKSSESAFSINCVNNINLIISLFYRTKSWSSIYTSHRHRLSFFKPLKP